MTIHRRRLKVIQFSLGGVSFECQVKSWTMPNNTALGERIYSFCPDGEDREEVDPDYVLELVFYSDWRRAPVGISEFLVENRGQTVTYQIDHHYDVPGEWNRWTGQCIIIAPGIGGDARTTELTTVTLPIIGDPHDGKVAMG